MTQALTSRAAQFRESLSQRIFVADGAMGTMLYSRGVFINRCFDELNLSAPGMVAEIHQEYVDAGAEILETNTFGANRTRLAGFGLAEKTVAINQAGVRLAREAASEGIYVAGAMGPLGVRFEPLGAMSFAEARDVFREQAEALCEAGVDLLILETFADLDELREAVLAAREAAGDEMVIVAQVTIGDSGELPGGASALDFVRQANDWPADVIGFNCSVGPKTTLKPSRRRCVACLKPMSAMPNAGLPARVEGRNIYLCSPEYMAQYARRLLRAGVRIIGGCCGTTPEHIKLIVQRRVRCSLARPEDACARNECDPKSAPPEVRRVAVPLREKSKLGAKLAAGKFVAFVEILPPRGMDASREIAGAQLVRRSTASTASTSRMGRAPAPA